MLIKVNTNYKCTKQKIKKNGKMKRQVNNGRQDVRQSGRQVLDKGDKLVDKSSSQREKQNLEPEIVAIHSGFSPPLIYHTYLAPWLKLFEPTFWD